MALPINSLYSLTWGDYGTSLVSAIQLLRCHGELVDCTLAAGGRSFPAHKIVLCAASPFLWELLKNTPCKHPVVMLAGVNPNDLEALLEFVYRGEVSVDHSQLPSLLQAAHCLNIQGLAPQTMSKDDYTTHIQLQQMIPQHHVKTVIDDQEQLIATIAPQQTVHAQVVEDLNSVGTIMTPKDRVIEQFLPARKRKPRVKKERPMNTIKVARTDGMENVLITTNATNAMENGGDILLPPQSIKTEHPQNDTVLTVPSDNTIGTPQTTNTTTSSSTKSGSKQSRSRSQSEQPATCPICYAVIRQSRNLRRHLELRHFAKHGVKKERKSTSSKKSASSAANSASTVQTTNSTPQVQTVQAVHTLQTVQVKKDPETMLTGSNQISPVSVSVQGSQHVQHHQQQQTTAIIDQSGNITTTTTGGNGQQQQQICTQTENTDGTTSLSIAQVQTLQGQTLTLGNLNQQKNHNIVVKKVFILKGNNNT